MKKVSFLILTCILSLAFISIQAQNLKWGDLGNGKYANPLLNADYSDPDVVRVNNKYYMVCSQP